MVSVVSAVVLVPLSIGGMPLEDKHEYPSVQVMVVVGCSTVVTVTIDVPGCPDDTKVVEEPFPWDVGLLDLPMIISRV